MQNNKKVKVAVVGCGNWGENLVRNFAELGNLAAISDPNMEHVGKLAHDYGVPIHSLEEILQSQQIDGVVIATPAELHSEIARKSLQAGKHVFVEKPLALDCQKAEELCAMAMDRNCILMVGHLLQYHPAFLSLKDIVEKGQLGVMQYIYSNRLNLGKIRREENILWSFAPHDISMILSLVGIEPDIVRATGEAFLHDNTVDTTITHLSFPNNVKGHIFVSWLHPFKEQKLVVIGSKGMAVFDDGEPWDRKIKIYSHEIDFTGKVTTSNKAEPKFICVDKKEPLSNECQHFIDCIETGRTPRTDGIEGVKVLRVLQAAQDSLDGINQ